MSRVPVSCAEHDVPEDISFAPVPDPERAQHIQLALQRLDPLLDHQESHSQGLIPSSTFSSSTSSEKVLRQKRKYRPPALKLDAHALQHLEPSQDLSVTKLGSRHIKSQRSLPTLRTVPLSVRTHAYHQSSVTFNFPNSSPTSATASSPAATPISATKFLAVPPAHSPVSPSTPPPPSPSTVKKKRFMRLCRKFGEAPPPELVFGRLPVPVGVEPRKGRVQNAPCFPPTIPPIMEEGTTFFAPMMQESKEYPLSCNLDTSSTSDMGTSPSGNLHRPSSILLKDAGKLQHISRQYSTACLLERKGQRITQRNYEDILKRLRML
ncbi:uncharacterized protein EDB93DRAFT_284656 [Suillus bovinus]|uniref:uncharacterized protein n=1 Tax=Suillus bovinus TaxID=48563 RepID=UPI001B85F200|nr:uncharacterized protein EDB93DRAFT_284656 [Suillus bovinus]KAG2159381.1 hypothetical protein EDB93DRAFT_284656 [Suillus bovinus]